MARETLSAECEEHDGDVRVSFQEWSPEEDELCQVSDGKGRRKLNKGVCLSQKCPYLDRRLVFCTQKVQFTVNRGEHLKEATIYTKRTRKRTGFSFV